MGYLAELVIDRTLGKPARGLTVHLFDGSQPGAKTGDDTYRTICGLTVASGRCRIARGEPICQRCVTVENARVTP